MCCWLTIYIQQTCLHHWLAKKPRPALQHGWAPSLMISSMVTFRPPSHLGSIEKKSKRKWLDNIAALQHLTREIYEGDDNIVKNSTVYYVLLEWTNYCSCAADSMQGSGKGTFSERIRRSFFVLGFSLIETGSGWVDWKESYALFFHSVVRSAGAQIVLSWCSAARTVLSWCSNYVQLVLKLCSAGAQLCSAGAYIVF